MGMKAGLITLLFHGFYRGRHCKQRQGMEGSGGAKILRNCSIPKITCRLLTPWRLT